MNVLNCLGLSGTRIATNFGKHRPGVSIRLLKVLRHNCRYAFPHSCKKSHKTLISWEKSLDPGNHCQAIKFSNIDLNEAKLGKSFIFDYFDKVEYLNENLFFHFFYEIFVNSGSLLITTSKPPNEINFSLSDLESRINSCISAKIELPDDDFLFSILIKELSDKKIFLNDKHCLYIIKRIKRNYKSISLFAETLDIMSLEKKTKITLKQIKEVLNIIEA